MKHKKYFKKPQDNFSYTSTRENLSMYDREPISLKKSIKNQFFFHDKTILSINKKYLKIYKNITAIPITDKMQSFFLYNFFYKIKKHQSPVEKQAKDTN